MNNRRHRGIPHARPTTREERERNERWLNAIYTIHFHELEIGMLKTDGKEDLYSRDSIDNRETHLLPNPFYTEHMTGSIKVRLPFSPPKGITTVLPYGNFAPPGTKIIKTFYLDLTRGNLSQILNWEHQGFNFRRGKTDTVQFTYCQYKGKTFIVPKAMS